MFLEHALAVNEALLEGHPVCLQALQLVLHFLRDRDLVLTENVELVMEGLKLSFNVGDV